MENKKLENAIRRGITAGVIVGGLVLAFILFITWMFMPVIIPFSAMLVGHVIDNPKIVLGILMVGFLAYGVIYVCWILFSLLFEIIIKMKKEQEKIEEETLGESRQPIGWRGFYLILAFFCVLIIALIGYVSILMSRAFVPTDGVLLLGYIIGFPICIFVTLGIYLIRRSRKNNFVSTE